MVSQQRPGTISFICKVIRDAGRPLSRKEISTVIASEEVSYLRRHLEEMLKAGILVSHTKVTDHGTTVIRYTVADEVNCSEL